MGPERARSPRVELRSPCLGPRLLPPWPPTFLYHQPNIHRPTSVFLSFFIIASSPILSQPRLTCLRPSCPSSRHALVPRRLHEHRARAHGRIRRRRPQGCVWRRLHPGQQWCASFFFPLSSQGVAGPERPPSGVEGDNAIYIGRALAEFDARALPSGTRLVVVVDLRLPNRHDVVEVGARELLHLALLTVR